MSKLTPQQFARVESLFFEAGRIPEQQRDAFLAAACADDALVKEEVQGLLKQSGSRLSSTPLLTEVGRAITPTRDGVHALIGKTVGAYEIISIIGHGGMGVVYLARDTRLGRDVAIKAIPPSYTDNPARLARFVREAKMLASLSHPNIATVHGLEECDRSQLLVMELVEGKTLSKRLADGALPIGEALAICRQIAEGVEAAHDAGVIHRDLKPGNVMITPEGRAKVLDFGLARELRGSAVADASQNAAANPAPPTDGHHTREGAVLGTPGYMSPEQVRGASLDRRTDVFSFGCILYECLTGKLAFTGNTQADVLAAVLDREPDWSLLPARTPERVRRLLQRCTAKDLSYRLRDIGDAWLELDESLKEKQWLSAESPGATGPDRARDGIVWRIVPWVAAAAAVIALGAIVLTRQSPAVAPPPATLPPTPPLYRFSLPFPMDHAQTDLPHVRVALTHDGSKLAVSATDGQSLDLWLRDRDEGIFRKIEGTTGGFIPAFSPDGQWLLYYDFGVLTRKRLTGGGGVKVVTISSHSGAHQWGNDDAIYYVPFWGRGIARVSAQGGPYEMLTQPAFSKGDYGHISPFPMPDGKHLLYVVWDGATKTRIDAINRTSGQVHNVVQFGGSPHLAQTPIGNYLLYERASTLYAAPIDLATAKITGTETALADGVLNDRVYFAAAFDVSDDGTLAYVPGPAFAEDSRISWIDLKTGIASPVNDDRLSFVEPHFSADGKRLSMLLKGDVYRPIIYDMEKNTFDHVLVEGDTNSASISPDGTMFAYSNNRDGPYTLYVRNLTERRDEKMFDQMGDVQNPIVWSPDGKYVAFSYSPTDMEARDITYVDVENKTTHSFCDTPAEERSMSFSPDGKWMAFASTQSGTREIFIRSFPDGKQTRQISFGGGDWPQWAPLAEGKSEYTLYFLNAAKLYSVQIASQDGSVISRPALFYDKPFGQADYNLPSYAVAPDGRLLIIESSERGPKLTEIRMLLNWYRLLDPNRDIGS